MFGRVARLGWLLVLVGTVGCGSDGPPEPLDHGGPEGQKIAEFLSEFNEVKYDLPRLKKMFAAPPPANLKKYDEYNFNLAGKVAVTGDTATGKVTIRPESGSGEDVTREWTFVKEGGNWKVKSAPLP